LRAKKICNISVIVFWLVMYYNVIVIL